MSACMHSQLCLALCDPMYCSLLSSSLYGIFQGSILEQVAIFQCSLLKLSEEMYRHLFAEFDRMNNPFMEPGFSSPAFTYTNVRNGLGYFCGYSAVKTDWIKDTLFEKR